ncbi:MAG: hypothetical protein N2449_01210 [Bacteroidales bacterium]|nr:hypothetical protein [Bacteroidales bacterium]
MTSLSLSHLFSNQQIIGFLKPLISQIPNLSIALVKPRRTKYGTMQFFPATQQYRITLNNDLNEWFRLYVLLHEFAHVLTHKQIQRKEKAHGKTWQQNFLTLLHKAIEEQIFPEYIATFIHNEFLTQPSYSSSKDYLIKYCISQEHYLPKQTKCVKDYQTGQTFSIFNRKFKVLKRFRTRSLCLEIHTHKRYIIQGFIITDVS